MKKLRNCILAILLAMLLTACVSTDPIVVDKVIVPELTFPTFPLAESMTDTKDGTVSVPSEWLVRLEEYHIKIEATEEYYKGLKKIYEQFYGDNIEKSN